MEVAVIGGGIIGVCNAYFLAAAGHKVTVFERNASVAEESSFAHTGIIAPGYVAPWAAPGMPGKILSHIFSRIGPVAVRPKPDLALWRWIRRWLPECRLERYRINRARMHRIASYSSDLLHQLRKQHQLDFQNRTGVLQLLRSKQDVQRAQPAFDLLSGSGIAYQLLDADGARRIEPALGTSAPLAAALYLPQDETGNCALFAKQLKTIAKKMGVEFRFKSTVAAVASSRHEVILLVNGEPVIMNAAVIAAGIDSTSLLAGLGIRVPLYPVTGYSVTTAVRHPEHAPATALIDEAYKVAITCIGNRIRVAGTAELGFNRSELRSNTLRALFKVAEDWLPHAANYNNARVWRGVRPMLPDEVPLLGAAASGNIYVNIGHGSHGWAMAAGCGKVIADLVSLRKPEIDMEGLTLARYG